LTPITATANYTIDQSGNALEWQSDTEIVFSSGDSDTNYFDYVFTLSSI
jgi:hypothetical protein